MNTTKRYFKYSLKVFLFCVGTCAALLSVSVSAADEESSDSEIRVEEQVNINTASAETLALALDGVGATRALDIIAYREENGDFETIEQLQEVTGIGPATVERNRMRILLTDGTE
ncbi:MAG: ComEA family DNA-binding protein [Pseudohongiella sp.]|uniref:ComEA family DNA-binding protein n=1 Tax=Pseudohongiella sp. TaxID=1979412 RepID=UPI00349FE3AD